MPFGGTTPIAITDIERTGGVVSLSFASPFATSVAVHQAIVISGVTADQYFDGIYEITAVPSTTALSYKQPGAPDVELTSGSPGTVCPAKQWIALDAITERGGEFGLNVEMWFAVPASNELPGGGASSLPSNLLTAAEIAAFSAGRLYAIQRQLLFGKSTSAEDMIASLDTLYADIFAYRVGTVSPGIYWGNWWDGINGGTYK